MLQLLPEALSGGFNEVALRGLWAWATASVGRGPIIFNCPETKINQVMTIFERAES